MRCNIGGRLADEYKMNRPISRKVFKLMDKRIRDQFRRDAQRNLDRADQLRKELKRRKGKTKGLAGQTAPYSGGPQSITEGASTSTGTPGIAYPPLGDEGREAVAMLQEQPASTASSGPRLSVGAGDRGNSSGVDKATSFQASPQMERTAETGTQPSTEPGSSVTSSLPTSKDSGSSLVTLPHGNPSETASSSQATMATETSTTPRAASDVKLSSFAVDSNQQRIPVIYAFPPPGAEFDPNAQQVAIAAEYNGMPTILFAPIVRVIPTGGNFIPQEGSANPEREAARQSIVVTSEASTSSLISAPQETVIPPATMVSVAARRLPDHSFTHRLQADLKSLTPASGDSNSNRDVLSTVGAPVPRPHVSAPGFEEGLGGRLHSTRTTSEQSTDSSISASSHFESPSSAMPTSSGHERGIKHQERP